MATITQIRDAIAAKLTTITSLNVYPTAPDSIIAPAATVGMPVTIEYDYTMRANNLRMTIPIRVFAGRIQEDYAQDVLDSIISYEGANSIPLLFSNDPRINTTVSTARITEARNYGVYEVEGIQYIGVEFLLEVIS